MPTPISRRCLLLAGSAVLSAKGSPRFEQVDLFKQGDGGAHTYRIPALVETRKGTLIAMADVRHDSARDLPARISLGMRRSFDRGRTWSTIITVRSVTEGGVGDPSLLLDRKSGRIWCFHAYGPPGIGFFTGKAGSVTGPDTLQLHAIWSDDDGTSWSRPIDLTPQIKDPSWLGMFSTSGTHFQTSRRRFIVPMVVRDGEKKVTARNAYSDDAGVTWKIGPAIVAGSDESKAIELQDGTILQNMRNGNRRAIARSRDGGITFDGENNHDPALIDPSCNAGLARYRFRGKDLLLFANAASAKRENLTIRISADGGKTWPNSRVLHAGPAAYSTVIQLRDGSIAVMYECGDKQAAERIRFARFDLGWVLEGA